jgi:hypothetical protein
LPVSFLEDFEQAFAHGEGRLARGGRGTSDRGRRTSDIGLQSKDGASRNLTL